MRVLVSDPVAKEGIEILKKEATVEVKTGLKPAELIQIIGDYDALVVRSETKVTADVINAGKKLQIIGRAGVGVDNIDVAAATKKGIIVVNAPAGNTISAAEHTVAMILALARNIPQAYASLKNCQWKRADFVGTEVRGKILGIVGLGNVGTQVARRAKGFEMEILAYDPFTSPERAKNLGVEMAQLDDLLKRSDFITLHLPLTDNTRGMIGPKEIAMMKPTARIINCARGGIVDEQLLYDAVEQGKLAGAAVDVFVKEPTTDCVLFKSNKVIFTPHLAASTAEAQVTVAVDVAQQIADVFKGKPARYAVNAPLIAPEVMERLAPFMNLSSIIAKIVYQLGEGQMTGLRIEYGGEVAGFDTTALKTNVIGVLFGGLTEERVNIVNANFVAASRGIKVIEEQFSSCENYSSLITVEAETSKGTTTVSGTILRGEPHIVRVNNYYIDFVPSAGYFLFCDHLDRPGLISAVGAVTGNADINISSMQVGRLKPRGPALMVLGLDQPLAEKNLKQILSIPDVYGARMVKL